jgi:REP element-mobilizing transposase RayT
MTPTHQEFSDDHTPTACFITFRSYGTWLHGDQRRSVDRFHNRYGTPKLAPNPQRRKYEESLLKRPPVKLTAKQRAATEDAIRDTCKTRKWILWAVNVRTNHAHSVVTADCNSRVVRSALKANATRTMRERGCWRSEDSPWAARGRRRSLWSQKDLLNAIDYVLYDQGEPLP